MERRQAYGLEPQVILVRPEPRCRRVNLRRADDSADRADRLIVGVLDRFDPDRRAFGKSVGVRGAIPDGINVRKAGAAVFVDADSIAALGARGDQRGGSRNYPDADDHHLHGDETLVGQPDPRDPLVALDRHHPDAGAQIDPLRAVLRLEERRKLGPGDPRQHPREDLEQRHRLAQLAQGGCRFEPDVAAADHRDPLDLG